MKTFYRINHEQTQQGLWYAFNGDFTGLIHDTFNFCMNSELKMDFDPELVGFLSAVTSIDDLYHWFSKADIIRLQELGWFIHEYQTDDFKWYNRFSHWVINQTNSLVVRKIVLTP